jgi:hypothetical protein
MLFSSFLRSFIILVSFIINFVLLGMFICSIILVHRDPINLPAVPIFIFVSTFKKLLLITPFVFSTVRD